MSYILFKSAKPSETFFSVFKTASSNATNRFKSSITAKDIRDIAKFRLKHGGFGYVAELAELKKMITLRGAINNSAGLFKRNGTLSSIGKYVFTDIKAQVESSFIVKKLLPRAFKLIKK